MSASWVYNIPDVQKEYEKKNQKISSRSQSEYEVKCSHRTLLYRKLTCKAVGLGKSLVMILE